VRRSDGVSRPPLIVDTVHARHALRESVRHFTRWHPTGIAAFRSFVLVYLGAF